MNARNLAAARAPSSISVGPGFLHLVSAVAARTTALARALFNRRQLGKLHELSDHELCDIGLTRDDLHFNRSFPFSADPTAEIARRARRNTLR
ncbi:DUF1127 domain-containing protein [Hoeflea olei]|uniref:YjiS-like domain-containing protein n=1 Tax=Hoeflea olei TaxID=1480615 RepID=A0A1C1YU90_9HYPH|nr:DUF1127 domain-containing protein [Hoeflea olei]OCW57082.1 hypothetical protein AWJ14_08000 [Hoeflea olei]